MAYQNLALELKESKNVQSPDSRSVQKLYFIARTIDPRNYIKVQAYDPELNKWSKEKWPKPTLNRGSFGLTITNKKVIIAGGEYRRRATNSVEYLDLETNQWTNLPAMILARMNPDLIEVDGDLYVISERNNEGSERAIEKFNFTSSKWEERCPLPESLSNWYVQFVALNGLLYGNSTYTMFCYDPVSNEWIQKAAMSEDRIEGHIAAVNGYLYAVGGKTIERYDPLKDSWSFVKPCSQERFSGMCAEFNNRLIICGRFSGMTYSNLIVAEYDPESNEWKNLEPLKSNVYSCKYLFSVPNLKENKEKNVT